MVGVEMAIYNFHQSSMNRSNIGKMIMPIDQNNSNTSDVIILAAPLVISTTEIIDDVMKNTYFDSHYNKCGLLFYLHIIEPAVYINAQDAAVSQRNNTWNS